MFGASPGHKTGAGPDPYTDSEDAFCAPDRSNYRSLMSAGSDGRGRAAFSPTKTPRKQIYSPQLRRFKELVLRRPVTLTKTGRSRISRANCPRWPGSTGGGSFGP